MREHIRLVLMGVLILNLVNIVTAAMASFLWRSFSEVFGILALLEAAVLFLAAGGMDLHSSRLFAKARQFQNESGKKWSLQDGIGGQKKATKFLAMGTILFSESLLLVIL